MKFDRPPRFSLSPVMLAFWVAASRVRENDHHPADVVTGGCIGSAWVPWPGSWDFWRAMFAREIKWAAFFFAVGNSSFLAKVEVFEGR